MIMDKCSVRKQLIKKKRNLEEFRSLQNICYINSEKREKEEEKIINDIKNLENLLNGDQHD